MTKKYICKGETWLVTQLVYISISFGNVDELFAARPHFPEKRGPPIQVVSSLNPRDFIQTEALWAVTARTAPCWCSEPPWRVAVVHSETPWAFFNNNNIFFAQSLSLFGELIPRFSCLSIIYQPLWYNWCKCITWSYCVFLSHSKLFKPVSWHYQYFSLTQQPNMPRVWAVWTVQRHELFLLQHLCSAQSTDYYLLFKNHITSSNSQYWPDFYEFYEWNLWLGLKAT